MPPDRSDRLIRRYFHLGLNYDEILATLTTSHNIVISKRTLHRKLRTLGLFRRKNHSDILDIACFIQNELHTSGQLKGYRWLHLRCRQHGLCIDKETVRILLGLLDPDGVQQRARRRLQRRIYHVPGPNFQWHVDSYDKLKRYGICINGCIDGFSRSVLWLEAYTTSSNPSVIAGYFMETVQSKNGVPRVIRSDMGTENAFIKQMQQFLRRNDEDELAGGRSFLEGTSQHNQRIECWWSILRKCCTQYWMDLFGCMKHDGLFTGDHLDISLVQFCFMNLIQEDLDAVVKEWNYHHLTPSRNQNGPFGRPSVMYTIPEIYGAREFLVPVPADEIEVCNTECTFKGPYPCDITVFDLCSLLMEEHQLHVPTNGEEGLQLYTHLRRLTLNEIDL